MLQHLRSFRHLSLFYAAFILLSSIGVPSVKHYCSGKWISTHFQPKEACAKKVAEHVFACCLKDVSSCESSSKFDHSDNNCCDNETILNKADGDQWKTIESKIDADLEIQWAISAYPMDPLISSFAPICRTNANPPPDLNTPRYILYQQFRC